MFATIETRVSVSKKKGDMKRSKKQILFYHASENGTVV